MATRTPRPEGSSVRCLPTLVNAIPRRTIVYRCSASTRPPLSFGASAPAEGEDAAGAVGQNELGRQLSPDDLRPHRVSRAVLTTQDMRSPPKDFLKSSQSHSGRLSST
jgi:hypothetical protein